MTLRHTPFHWLTSCCYSYIKFLSVIFIIQWHWTTLKSFLCCLLISFTFHNLNDNTFHRTELHSFMLKLLKVLSATFKFFKYLKMYAQLTFNYLELRNLLLATLQCAFLCKSCFTVLRNASSPFLYQTSQRWVKSGDHKMPARVHLARSYQSFFWRPLGSPLTSFCEAVLCRVASKSTKYIR